MHARALNVILDYIGDFFFCTCKIRDNAFDRGISFFFLNFKGWRVAVGPKLVMEIGGGRDGIREDGKPFSSPCCICTLIFRSYIKKLLITLFPMLQIIVNF